MADLKERYVKVTRDAKDAIKERNLPARTAEEQRVFKAFRTQAKAAYGTLRPRSTAKNKS
ncbi:hypothetical protein [Mesorhizobium sp. BH1-1-4]|uniref:hypothetical protein n=1 Tax=Mesorhizobium sp. BH1-1-4 TaxID=2876662 RepID=UPI001CD1379C|nr:hypothetical protein [Mesorhizobium sp. BH1-1-4]MBZ9995860.1 hypothetical protein [Mesorhizobium sp. BH1-1-4]